MKSIICMFLLSFCVTAIIVVPIFADDEKTASAEPIIFSYEKARSLALSDMLSIIDWDAQIRDLQDLRGDLRDEMHILQSGDWMRDRTTDLLDLLWQLDLQMFGSNMQHTQINEVTAAAMRALLDTLRDMNLEHSEYMLAYALQSTIIGIMANQHIGNNIAMIEQQQALVLRELDALRNGTIEQDMKTDIRNSIASVDQLMQNLELQQEHAKLMREHALRTNIIIIHDLDHSIELMQAQLVIAETALQHSEFRHQLGRLSANAVQFEQQRIELMRLDYQNAHHAREAAMQHLNNLLGQPLNQNTVIIIYREQLLPGFDTIIQDYISTAAVYRSTLLEVNRTRDARRAVNGRPRDEIAPLQEAYDRAVLEHNQVRTELEVRLRNHINDFENLTNQMYALIIEQQQALSQLEVAQQNFELGHVTQHELDIHALSFLRLEHHAETILNQKWLLSFLMAHPAVIS